MSLVEHVCQVIDISAYNNDESNAEKLERIKINISHFILALYLGPAKSDQRFSDAQIETKSKEYTTWLINLASTTHREYASQKES